MLWKYGLPPRLLSPWETLSFPAFFRLTRLKGNPYLLFRAQGHPCLSLTGRVEDTEDRVFPQ